MNIYIYVTVSAKTLCASMQILMDISKFEISQLNNYVI